MFGWLSEPATRDSRRNRWAKDASEAWKAPSSLSATNRSRSVWRARYTSAMPPRPSSRRISYRPTVFMTSGIRVRPSSLRPTLPLPGQPFWSRTFLASVAGVVSPQPAGTATLSGTEAEVGQGRAQLKLFVLDTHTIYRRGLAACLELLDGVEAVADAESVRDAWETQGLFGADLVVLDHAIPGGRDFIGAVSESTGASVLVCTSDCSEDSVLSAMQAG